MSYFQKINNYIIVILSNCLFVLLPLVFILGNAAINITLTLLLVIFIYSTFIKKDFTIYSSIYFKILLLFWAYLIINSTLINFNETSLIKSFAFVRFLLLPFAIIYFLKNKMINEKIIFYFFIIIISLVSIDIIFQYMTGQNYFGYIPKMCTTVSGGLMNADSLVPKFNIVNIIDHPTTTGDQVLINCERYSGIFNEELIAGSYLLLFALPFLVFLMIFNKKIRYSKFLFLISSILIITASILTGDRAPVLIILIAFLLFFLFYGESLKKKILSIILGFGILSILIYSIPHLKHRFISWPMQTFMHENDDRGVFVNRKEETLFKIFVFETQWGLHFLTAYDIAKENIFFGSGVRSFREKCQKYDIEYLKSKYLDPSIVKEYKDGPNTGCSTHPHNIYLELLAETGVLGLSIFIFFLSTTLIRVYLQNKAKNNIIFISTLVILISLFSPLKPTGSFFSTFNAYIMWIIISFYLYWSEIKFKKLSDD